MYNWSLLDLRYSWYIIFCLKKPQNNKHRKHRQRTGLHHRPRIVMPSPDSVIGLRSSRKPAAEKRGSRRRLPSRQALQNSSSNEKRRHYHRNEKHRSTHWKQKKRFHINHLQRQRERMSQFLKGEIDPDEEKFLETVARI